MLVIILTKVAVAVKHVNNEPLKHHLEIQSMIYDCFHKSANMNNCKCNWVMAAGGKMIRMINTDLMMAFTVGIYAFCGR